jgi:hypothetical protein
MGDSQLSPTIVGTSRRRARALPPASADSFTRRIDVSLFLERHASRILDKHVNPWLLRPALRS